MAIIVAAASGNWSAPGTWVGGVVPGDGDTARCGAFTVTIDVNVNIGVGTLEGDGVGKFQVTSAPLAITANILSSVGVALLLSHASGTVTLNGNVQGGNAVTASAFAVNNSSTGNLIVNGAVTMGASATTTVQAINNASTGTITINGSVTAGASASHAVSNAVGGTITIIGEIVGGSGTGSGCNNATTGTVTITGNVTGGSVTGPGVVNTSIGAMTINGNAKGGTGTNAYGARNSAGGTLTINGDAEGGTGSNAQGAINAAGGTLLVNGTAIGNNYGVGGGTNQAVGMSGVNTTGAVTACRAIRYGPFGMSPTLSAVDIIPTAGQNQATIMRSDNHQPLVLTNPADTQDLPAASNVRHGVVYANGSLTGTCRVPTISQVANGIPVDVSGVGIAALAVSDVWSYSSRTLTAPVPAASNPPSVDASTIQMRKGVTFDATLIGIAIPSNWTSAVLTVKRRVGEADAKAVLQVRVSNPGAGGDGLVLLNGAVSVAGNAGLVVNSSAGTVAIHIEDEAAAAVAVGSYWYDVKFYFGSSDSVATAPAQWHVSAVVTEGV